MIRSHPRVLLVALALIPAVHLVVLVPELWRAADAPRGFMAYILAAERVRADEPLYEPVPTGPHVPGEGRPYLYPPFLAAITALIPLSGIALSRFALLAGVLCFWVYAACLARVAAGRMTTYGVLLWGALLTAGIFPLSTLWVGQIDSLIWALFGIALAFPLARGFGFAAAAMTKPFAVWPLGLALWRERGPVAVGASLAITVAVGLAALAMGPVSLVRASLEWLTHIYPTLSQGQFAYIAYDVTGNATLNHVLSYLGHGNLSLGFLPLQLAHAAGWEFAGPELPGWARVYLTTVGLAAPIITLWITRYRAPELRYAAVMSAAVLFGPIFRATYAPILYALAAAWIADRRRERSGTAHRLSRPCDNRVPHGDRRHPG
jgi:hypothetical protein